MPASAAQVTGTFVVTSKTANIDGSGVVTLSMPQPTPVEGASSEESPSGQCQMRILNSAALDAFTVGQVFTLHFVPRAIPAPVKPAKKPAKKPVRKSTGRKKPKT